MTKQELQNKIKALEAAAAASKTKAEVVRFGGEGKGINYFLSTTIGGFPVRLRFVRSVNSEGKPEALINEVVVQGKAELAAKLDAVAARDGVIEDFADTHAKNAVRLIGSTQVRSQGQLVRKLRQENANLRRQLQASDIPFSEENLENDMPF